MGVLAERDLIGYHGATRAGSADRPPREGTGKQPRTREWRECV
jgi:hypothetical protein